MIPEVLPSSPRLVAPETYVIPTFMPFPTGGYVGAHSLVIRGAEPIVVDTGCELVREHWTEQVFSLVEPEDVRWVYVSHDDHDHVGNLLHVLERCPNATLVANFVLVARLAADIDLPFERMRWVDVGETFSTADRTLTIVRPPMFDAPSSRGFVDSETGLFWAVDSFGAHFPGAVLERSDVPDDLYDETFPALNTWNTPWLEWVDATSFDRHLATSASLGASVVASAHGPVLRDDQIPDAYERTRALVGRPPADHPHQDALEVLLTLLAGGES